MFKRIILIIIDLMLLISSLYISLHLRYNLGHVEYNFINHVYIFSPVFLIWIIIYYTNELYDFPKFFDKIFILYAILRSSLFNFVITVVFFYIIPQLILTPKTILVLMILFSGILIYGWRVLFNRIFISENLLKKIIIIGNDKIETDLAKQINHNRSYGYKLVGLVIANQQRRVNHLKNIGLLPELDKILKRKKTDAIAIDVNHFRLNNEIFQVISDHCLAKNIEVIDIYYLYENLTGKVPLSNLSQIWFTNFNQSTKKWNFFFKRVFDILISIIGLTLFTLLLPLLYLLVKIDSRGPFFYSQDRMGRHGKIFKIYKIRTMYQSACQSNKTKWAQPGDKRITIIGRLLRKTCLDELPQFFNILSGEMSFVGPRPERPEIIAKLSGRQKLYYKRHLIKPGLTGWAQVMSRYGASFSDADEKLQYDLYYLKNRSVFLDFLIILRTIRMLFVNRGGV